MRIEKETQTVVVYAYNYRIKCDVFTQPGSRLSDFINGLGQRQFIPVSNAVVSDIFGNPICKAKFLELNISEVLFVVPNDELLAEGKV